MMVYEAVIFGGVVFWILFLIFSAILIAEIEQANSMNPPVVTSIVFLVLLFVFTDVWKYFADDPVLTMLEVIGIYLVGGVMWALPRWLFLMVDLRRRLRTTMAGFCERHKVSTITPELGKQFADVLAYDMKLNEYGVAYSVTERRIIPPSFTKNREKLLKWMCFWPWSLFWTLLQNPFRWFFEAVADALHGLFQRISDKVFSEFGETTVETTTTTTSTSTTTENTTTTRP